MRTLGFIHVGGAQAAGPAMVIQSDTVRGVQQGMTAPGCVLNNQFKHKEEIVFRIRVIDTKTGKPMDKDQLKSLVIELPDGQKFPAHYGKHPPMDPIAYFWTFGWNIPGELSDGQLWLKVVATDKHGHTATFAPFEIEKVAAHRDSRLSRGSSMSFMMRGAALAAFALLCSSERWRRAS